MQANTSDAPAREHKVLAIKQHQLDAPAREHVVYHLAILLVFTTCEGFLLGALSANASYNLNNRLSWHNHFGLHAYNKPITTLLISFYRSRLYSPKKFDHPVQNQTTGNSSFGEAALETVNLDGEEETDMTAVKEVQLFDSSEEKDVSALNIGGHITLHLSTASISVSVAKNYDF